MRAEMLLAPSSCPAGARALNQDGLSPTGEPENWGAVGTGSIVAGDRALPAPSRAPTVPRARGDVGEVTGGQEIPPGTVPGRGAPVRCWTGPTELRLQACGAAARPPYGSSFCSCLDSLITWRGRRGTITQPGLPGL